MPLPQLHVITAIANPARWRSRLALYDAFERHMLDSGVHLTTVECAYGDEDHALTVRPGVEHVRVWAKTHIWTKENLLNIGLWRLPRDWRCVAWIDADVRFRHQDWANETVRALHFDVLQP